MADEGPVGNTNGADEEFMAILDGEFDERETACLENAILTGGHVVIGAIEMSVGDLQAMYDEVGIAHATPGLTLGDLWDGCTESTRRLFGMVGLRVVAHLTNQAFYSGWDFDEKQWRNGPGRL